VGETFGRQHVPAEVAFLLRHEGGGMAEAPIVAGRSGEPGEPSVLHRRGRRLEYLTTAWNSLEAVVAVVTGLAAHSLALVAFGLDSCIEVFASLVVLWHLGGAPEATEPLRARRALRLIAAAFGVLSLYLAGQAVHALIARTQPASAPVGIAFMGATVVVMFVLARAKRRTGRALGNRPLVANGTMTFIDGCLAAGVLVALGLQTIAGWWWTDPLAAGVVAIVAFNEAREGWQSADPHQADS
jgi:divalent metal cation (Fe/Co/Zn/Cd) transporter